MNQAANDVLAVFHSGLVFGLLAGALATLSVQDGWSEYQRWRRRLAAARARAIRCRKTWECLDDNGHDGPCVNTKECD